MPAEAYISGIDLRHVDRAIRLQDDLFRARNGGWLARTGVPPDLATKERSVDLAVKTEGCSANLFGRLPAELDETG
jgi:predicted metalloendopeptidase